MFLINAHGPDHGLSVEVDFDRHEVTVRDWGESCETPWEAWIQQAIVPLATLLDKSARHYDCGPVCDTSMHARIVSLAINWLGYWGGEVEHLGSDARPCDHFDMDYRGIGGLAVRAWPAHMKCATCKRVRRPG